MALTVDYDHPLLRDRRIEIRMDEGVFQRDLAWARTFGFQAEVEALWRSGRAQGGTLDCALVFGASGVLNPGGERGPDEALRHKVVDLLGDLGLLGFPLRARVEAVRPGHALHVAALRALLSHPDAFDVVEATPR